MLAVLGFISEKNIDVISGITQLIIAPGYTFRLTNEIITNFHQPKSTLLLLIAAFIGEDWKKIYKFALNNNFRFLSYGDSCLFLP
jgi:S-adenosylmethionine:tRNA ribosyltransferase-isomerase